MFGLRFGDVTSEFDVLLNSFVLLVQANFLSLKAKSPGRAGAFHTLSQYVKT